MDTATRVDGVRVIGPIREPELQAFETMSACLVNVVAPMAILLPKADILGFTGKGAIQWNMNVDTLCRYLNKDGISFAQTH